MTIKQIDKRIVELMKENKLNVNDKKLRIDLAIIYTEAQRDLLKENIKELETK